VNPAAALAALALTAGGPGFEASLGAAAGWDSNLSHSSSTSLAVGAGYGALRAGLGAAFDLGETTNLYAGLRLEGETYPTLEDLSTASAGVEAALSQDLSEAVAVVLAPSVAGSWSGDAARNATTLAGRLTLRWRPEEDLALRAFYGHASRSAADAAFSFERDRIGASAEWRVGRGTFLSLGYALELGGEVYYRAAGAGGGGMGGTMGGHLMNTFGRNEEAYRAAATAHALSPSVEVSLAGGLALEAGYTWRRVASGAGDYQDHSLAAGLVWRR